MPRFCGDFVEIRGGKCGEVLCFMFYTAVEEFAKCIRVRGPSCPPSMAVRKCKAVLHKILCRAEQEANAAPLAIPCKNGHDGHFSAFTWMEALSFTRFTALLKVEGDQTHRKIRYFTE